MTFEHLMWKWLAGKQLVFHLSKAKQFRSCERVVLLFVFENRI
jgi:hypothetical protein